MRTITIYDLYEMIAHPTKTRVVIHHNGQVCYMGYLQDVPAKYCLKKIKMLDLYCMPSATIEISI